MIIRADQIEPGDSLKSDRHSLIYLVRKVVVGQRVMVKLAIDPYDPGRWYILDRSELREVFRFPTSEAQ